MFASIASICLLELLASVVSSSPSRGRRGFSLDLHHHPVGTSRRAVHPQVSRHASTTANGVGLTDPAFDNQLSIDPYAKISVGTPPREVRLVLDTGSIDVWALSNQFPRKARKGHHYWTPRKSRTSSILDNYQWSTSYADHSGATGTAWTDTIYLGDATITSAAISAATGTPTYIYDPPYDGFIGLSNLLTQSPGTPSFMSTLTEQLLSANVFAMLLRYAGTGSIDFGFVDESKYTGDMQYTAVQRLYGSDKESIFWWVNSASYQVGSVSYNNPITNWFVDSGTTLLFTPISVRTNYYASIPSAQFSSSDNGIVYLCTETLPDFGLTFPDAETAGNTFAATVPGSQMTFQKLNSTYCYGRLQSVSSGQYILGSSFMRSFYVVFDHDNSRVGFAPQAS